jgi:hypothetical protein
LGSSAFASDPSSEAATAMGTQSFNPLTINAHR